MLTPRQFEIAKLVAETPLSMKEVAARVGISLSTVKFHMESVYAYFGIVPQGRNHGRIQLVHIWHKMKFKTFASYIEMQGKLDRLYTSDYIGACQ